MSYECLYVVLFLSEADAKVVVVAELCKCFVKKLGNPQTFSVFKI